MRYQRGIELIVGLFIILGFLAFTVIGLKVSGLTGMRQTGVYRLSAKFTNVGDLKIRAPVSMAGVKIGRVEKITLDPVTYKAIVTLDVENDNKNIPVDSTANIYTAGLIGANYISISPGFDETFLKDGEEIENTTQALVLQNIIGQLMYSLKGDKDKK